MISDKELLSRAVGIAAKAIDEGGGPFGAVIVRDGTIISEAANRVILNSDPTAHAEILAIRNAASFLGTHDLSDCILYTSCEPCPMCLGAIYWSGIKKVIYAAGRKDAANAGFNDEFIYNELELSPAERKVSFVNLNDKAATEVFSKWDGYGKKIPY